MKKIIAILASLTSCTVIFAADCMDSAVSQLDMNKCAASKATTSENELKSVYNQMLSLVKADPIATDKIKKSQEAWLKYRDAQIEMYYPPKPQGWYGSFHPVCVSNLSKELTESRIQELKKWLKKPSEGDTCTRPLYGKENN